MERPQLSIAFGEQPHAHEEGPRWFGLTMTHRALFDGLQDEWLPPPPGANGHLLLARAFPAVTGPSGSGSRHLIEVGLRLSPAVLGFQTVLAFRHGDWRRLPFAEVGEVEDDVEAVWWPGALPCFGITVVEVRTSEELARVEGIAGQVSNVPLPYIRVGFRVGFRVGAMLPASPVLPAPPRGASGFDALEFPPNYDAVRGAAAMAWWALPRTDPWFDLMAASMGGAEQELRECVAQVDAPWLSQLPWRRLESRVTSFDEQLWSAALRVLPAWSGPGSAALVDALAGAALEASAPASVVEDWRGATQGILRAEREIKLDAALAHPVGTALQLLVARSEPDRYKTWATDRRDIPPAIWWSGALLSGALHGYRRLSVATRGERSLREYLALRLLAQGSELVEGVRWLNDSGTARFMVGDRLLTEKPETARGAWFRSELRHPRLRAKALELAKQLQWPCAAREIRLADCAIEFLGEGKVDLHGAVLRAQGAAHALLPANATIHEVLDIDAFRRGLVSWGGQLGDHPPASVQAPASAAASFPQVAPNVPEVPGLVYLPCFLSPEQEAELLLEIDQAPWLDDLKRRVQHYGWKYGYKAKTITRDMRVGPLPKWAMALAQRLRSSGLLPWVADQVIVNEYLQNQGISKHVDCKPCFEEAIATISLLEPWHMRFCHGETKTKVERLLERGSVAVLTGEARYRWTHEIAKRKTEPGGFVRRRRVSLTFRKVKPQE